jgi:DHA2 family multidrug resistance protein-like MFS transporter
MTGKDKVSASPTEDMSPARRLLSYVGVVTAVFTTMIDTMAANMVLPTVSAEWGVSPATAAWIVSSYQLVLVCCLLPAAALSARFGIKRIYLFGLALLLCTSSVATLAPNLEILILARGFQGLATACLMSVNLALIRAIAPPQWLGRALGLNLTISAIGTTLGPTIAGMLISFVSWHFVFAISIPTTAIALLISIFTLRSVGARSAPINVKGIALSMLSAGTLLSGLNGLSQGWPQALVFALLACGIVLGFVFVRLSLGSPNPVLPVDLLRKATFSLSLAITNLTFTAQMVVFVSMPFFLQFQLGMTPYEAGLMFSIWPIAIASIAGVTGVLADRLPREVICTVGLLALCAGTLAMASPLGAPSQLQIGIALCVSGIGFGLYQVPNNSILLSSAPASSGSQAGSMLAIARLFGQALGVVLGTWGLSAAVEMSPFLVASGFVAIAAVISGVRLWLTNKRSQV